MIPLFSCLSPSRKHKTNSVGDPSEVYKGSCTALTSLKRNTV